MFSSIVQVLGLAGMAVGITMLSIPGGIIFSGVALVLIGLALEKSK